MQNFKKKAGGSQSKYRIFFNNHPGGLFILKFKVVVISKKEELFKLSFKTLSLPLSK